ncbi:hypothetical protein [Sphingomonas sp. BK069]|uniref:hypothetical protein n=1 Tax=Sphingomonas sp. BK069 TaxID=2586979 RepID=UPI0016197024|nr:hypothetical protein [Sphingomonas sp. BK069]MBB3347353.1 hypothetical protein [Sphingomonas sp. BK069]
MKPTTHVADAAALRDAFERGRHAGVNAGLQQAISLVLLLRYQEEQAIAARVTNKPHLQRRRIRLYTDVAARLDSVRKKAGASPAAPATAERLGLFAALGRALDQRRARTKVAPELRDCPDCNMAEPEWCLKAGSCWRRDAALGERR